MCFWVTYLTFLSLGPQSQNSDDNSTVLEGVLCRSSETRVVAKLGTCMVHCSGGNRICESRH